MLKRIWIYALRKSNYAEQRDAFLTELNRNKIKEYYNIDVHIHQIEEDWVYIIMWSWKKMDRSIT